MGEPSDLFEDYRRMVPREFDVERQGDVRTTPGEEYYIEHGWSGCDGSSWKRLTQATRDGWEAAARECARADRLQEQLS